MIDIFVLIFLFDQQFKSQRDTEKGANCHSFSEKGYSLGFNTPRKRKNCNSLSLKTTPEQMQ